MRLVLQILTLIFVLNACADNAGSTADAEADAPTYDTVANALLRLDPALDEIISPGARLEVLAEGYDWSEGPLWVASQDMLLFSDIPPNQIWKWTEEGGAELYLEPSGYTGDEPRGGEPGSNGLLLDEEGRLVLCQHGDRRLARMDAPLDDPAPEFVTLVGEYQGKRLNSPNDAVFDAKGNLYFTDPSYGMKGFPEPEDKQLPFQGVYQYTASGRLNLITDTLKMPNGIGLSPDESKLYVGCSDPANPLWVVFDISPEGEVSHGRTFLDPRQDDTYKGGGADGLKVDGRGTIFATGPGGVWVISPEGKHLGTIQTGQPTSNVALDETGTVLYITADAYLMRMKMR